MGTWVLINGTWYNISYTPCDASFRKHHLTDRRASTRRGAGGAAAVDSALPRASLRDLVAIGTSPGARAVVLHRVGPASSGISRRRNGVDDSKREGESQSNLGQHGHSPRVSQKWLWYEVVFECGKRFAGFAVFGANLREFDDRVEIFRTGEATAAHVPRAVPLEPMHRSRPGAVVFS